jgi:nitrate reductase cytochrome c-type subunit
MIYRKEKVHLLYLSFCLSKTCPHFVSSKYRIKMLVNQCLNQNHVESFCFETAIRALHYLNRLRTMAHTVFQIDFFPQGK